jgi:hypothetical protein
MDTNNPPFSAPDTRQRLPFQPALLIDPIFRFICDLALCRVTTGTYQHARLSSFGATQERPDAILLCHCITTAAGEGDGKETSQSLA